MGKFIARLAQASSRLHPQNIHIGHFVIDGGYADHRPERKDPGDDSMLDPMLLLKPTYNFIGKIEARGLGKLNSGHR